ncbi:MAG: type IV toxin-antitoxin system AbiEi family antitoxin domain-containing protein [Luteibaculum sp.]
MLLKLLSHYKSPNDKISGLIKSKQLIALRRGLYVVGRNLDLNLPHPFLIANHLKGPSYVSLETALAHWGLIPEKVFEVSSVTTQKPSVYDTPLGRFSFQQLKTPYYAVGVTSLALSTKQHIMMASPEKALCDKIILTAGIQLRSVTQTKAFLLEDLRISKDYLDALNHEDILVWSKISPKKSSITMLAKTLALL